MGKSMYGNREGCHAFLQHRPDMTQPADTNDLNRNALKTDLNFAPLRYHGMLEGGSCLCRCRPAGPAPELAYLGPVRIPRADRSHGFAPKPTAPSGAQREVRGRRPLSSGPHPKGRWAAIRRPPSGSWAQTPLSTREKPARREPGPARGAGAAGWEALASGLGPEARGEAPRARLPIMG
jgi:hypothetical protein